MDISHVLRKIILTIAHHITTRDRTWVGTWREVNFSQMANQ